MIESLNSDLSIDRWRSTDTIPHDGSLLRVKFENDDVLIVAWIDGTWCDMELGSNNTYATDNFIGWERCLMRDTGLPYMTKVTRNE